MTFEAPSPEEVEACIATLQKLIEKKRHQARYSSTCAQDQPANRTLWMQQSDKASRCADKLDDAIETVREAAK